MLALLAGSWRWLSVAWGDSLRYWLGWGGFAIICMTNLYLLRKRLPLLKNVGRVAGWLDFHILCGLIGPSLIVFHSNFKVGGLVAISFWSMMISAASGVVGRYFYTQLLQQRGSLKKDLKRYDEGFQKLHTMAPKIYTAAALAHAKHSAVRLAFGGHELKDVPQNPLIVLAYSILGDIQFYTKPIAVPAETSRAVHRKFKQYGIMQRKLLLLDTYKRLMGYWHTFHVPFAVFMYVVAVIHIIAELLFRVT